MSELSNIKSLAFHYFDGKISFSQEETLFSFLSENKANMALFREWEKEWAETNDAADLNNEWSLLNRKMMIKKSKEEHATEYKRFSLPFRRWQYVAVAAALIGFTVLTTLFVANQNSIKTQESIAVVEAPYGGKSKVMLSDGTVVWLNSGSSITYSKNKKNTEFRVVLEGEGYFEVAKQKSRKFIVQTSAYDVEVIGTKFNVSAYPTDRYVTTTLIEGKIDLMHGGGRTSVLPGESVSVDTLTGTLTKSVVPATASGAWTRNAIIFEDISLDDLIVKLSRQYNVSIKLGSKELGNKHFNIALRNNETIPEIMSAIEKILNVKIEHTGMNYYIKEK